MHDDKTPREVTAETLSDEMIRELRATLLRDSDNQFTADTDATGMALYDLDKYPPHLRADAQIIKEISRQRCAEIMNARIAAAYNARLAHDGAKR